MVGRVDNDIDNKVGCDGTSVNTGAGSAGAIIRNMELILNRSSAMALCASYTPTSFHYVIFSRTWIEPQLGPEA
ncbi:hypothetical protein AVEN_222207-1 [Araneus ventricosus]|uniref:Uncharacterized protein n=1 Tax=Araneus ventricosus TaxID=182803 RepID=A0A4Y2LE13_ARAVE|nr:hypothetical protein AVEN_222207-1 [Araneus ventricosus]